MKKIIFSFVLTGILIISLCSIAFSQIAKPDSKIKTISALFTAPAFSELFEQSKFKDVIRSTINKKALNNFKKNYEGATAEKWYITSDGFMAKFYLGNNPARVSYDNKGNWTYTLQQGTKDILPIEVRRMIMSNYIDFEITLVEDIDIVYSGKYYLVHMQDANSWMNLLLHGDEVTIMETLKKS
jgi:hypothetical protein